MSMTLFKTSFWTGISAFIKALLAYIMWKVIAVHTGPAGVALIEQFQNFIQISRASIPCGINAGVVKYVSEYQNDEEKKSYLLNNAIAMNLFFCFFISIGLIIFTHSISEIVFQSLQYQKVIILLAASTLLFASNNFALSVFNGEFDIKKYVIFTLLNTTLNFLITVILVIYFGLMGGLVGFVLNQSLIAFIPIYFLIKKKWFKSKCFFKKIKLTYAIKLSKYSLMVFTTTFITPLAFIIIRKYIAHSLTWEYAGYWQGIMRISEGYLILMNLILGFYFIPKFSSAQTTAKLRYEVLLSFKYIFPLVLLGVSLVFILKRQIVSVMYSPQFFPMIALFKYQLIGDVARMGTWLLTNILLAKALVKTFLFIEVFFSITYVLLSIFFVHYFGFIGCAIGFAANYIFQWIVMIIFSSLYLSEKPNFLKLCYK